MLKNPPLLCVKNLSISLKNKKKTNLVNNINFEINENEIFSLIGESGSGKTISALSVLGLLPKNIFHVDGEIYFKTQLINKEGKELYKEFRGKQIAISFQNSLTALNPVFKVGVQISDIIRTNLEVDFKSSREKVLFLFNEVKLDQPKVVYDMYPHQLSGGMAQRVMLALSLSCSPRLVIADEPTSSLDKITQIQILNLIRKIKEEKKFSLLLITHDLSLVSSISDSIAVMFKGGIVESGDARKVLTEPNHSYTKKLITTLKKQNSISKKEKKSREVNIQL